MKSLVEYIKENLLLENDDTIMYLIKDYDGDGENVIKSAVDFFKNSDMMKLKFCGSKTPSEREFKSGLDKLKRIYDYRDRHLDNPKIKSRPEPIVANRRGVGNFAFRRWVKDVINGGELSDIMDMSGKKPVPFKDSMFHDTKLSNVWIPSPEDMEEVISVGYNNVNLKSRRNSTKNLVRTSEDITDDWLWFNSVNEDENVTKADRIVNYYKEYRSVIDEIVGKMNSRLRKCPPLHKLPNAKAGGVSDEWKVLGEFPDDKKIYVIPKTDICSFDDEGNPTTDLRISVKKVGGSQPMSGQYNESLATLKVALRKAGLPVLKKDESYSIPENFGIDSSDEEVAKYLMHLMYESSGIKKDEDGWGHITGREEMTIGSLRDRINSGDDSVSDEIKSMLERFDGFVAEGNKYLKRLQKNEKFTYNMLYEALSGEVKFGKESPACAQYILEWDEDNPQKSVIRDIHGYINDMRKKKIVIFFGWKTTSKPLMSLRIELGKGKLDDSIRPLTKGDLKVDS